MIEKYDFGEITIDGKEYTSDVIISRDGVAPDWWRKESHKLHVEDIKSAIERTHPEILIVGTGYFGRMTVLPEVKDYANLKGVELIVEPTKQALKGYNDLCQTRKVIAALHLSC